MAKLKSLAGKFLKWGIWLLILAGLLILAAEATSMLGLISASLKATIIGFTVYAPILAGLLVGIGVVVLLIFGPRQDLIAFAGKFISRGLLFALIAGAAAAISGVGHRMGWWDYPLGFTILRLSAYLGIGTAIFCLIGGIVVLLFGPRKSFLSALIGLAIGAAPVVVPYLLVGDWQHYPVINDITTSTTNPPEFVALQEYRKYSPNGSKYGGARVAALQNRHFQDISSGRYNIPSTIMFDLAAAAVDKMGWQIVAAVPAEGRIEAVATTLLYGFKDDVVIRISRAGGGSIVDIRSASRVGKRDLGANANRIRKYLKTLREVVSSQR